MAGRQSDAERLEDASAQDIMVGNFLHNISTRHSTDKDGSLIVSAVVLPPGRLAIVDSANSCVKLFDLEARELIGKVVFPLMPWDITAIGEDRLAVVFLNRPDERRWRRDKQQNVQFLQLLSVTPKLARSITLPLPGSNYRGVTCQGDKLYLLCWDPHSIQIFNLYGTLLYQINNENNEGERLFYFPRHIAVSPDGAHIYVRDRDKWVCLTKEGEHVWTFRGEWPLFNGMDVDKRGRLFVCSGAPITILSYAGRPGTLLLDKEVRYPWAVAVDDGRMYIGSLETKEISVFGLDEVVVLFVLRLEAADSARQEEEDSEEYGDLDMEEEEEGEGNNGGDAVYANDGEDGDGGEGVLVYTAESIHEDSVESVSMQGEEDNGTCVRVEEADGEDDEEEGET